MCMEHALESYLEHSSLADVLLGERWDVRPVAAGNAFRVVLTMRIAVDEMQVYMTQIMLCVVVIIRRVSSISQFRRYSSVGPHLLRPRRDV